jgi:hypothetical protein
MKNKHFGGASSIAPQDKNVECRMSNSQKIPNAKAPMAGSLSHIRLPDPLLPFRHIRFRSHDINTACSRTPKADQSVHSEICAVARVRIGSHRFLHIKCVAIGNDKRSGFQITKVFERGAMLPHLIQRRNLTFADQFIPALHKLSAQRCRTNVASSVIPLLRGIVRLEVLFRRKFSSLRDYSNKADGCRDHHCNAETSSHGLRLSTHLQTGEPNFVIRVATFFRHSTLVIRHFPTLNSQLSTNSCLNK